MAGRWDTGNQWIGLEVKGLLNGPGERQANDWRKLIEIFEKGSAREQLQLAKIKGASKTALLLDDGIDFDPRKQRRGFPVSIP